MSAPLIAPRWRAVALACLAVAVLVTGWLAVLTYDSGTTRFDTWALRTSEQHIGAGAARLLLDLSEPWLSFAVLFLVAAAAAFARRWRLVLLTGASAGIAVVLTEHVLKPLVDRYLTARWLPQPVPLDAYVGAFPSGHETGVASAAVAVLIACGQLRLPAVVRMLIVDLLALWVVLAAVGLVRNYYHYATDTIGAVGVSVTVAVAMAFLLDHASAPVTERFTRRRQLT